MSRRWLAVVFALLLAAAQTDCSQPAGATVLRQDHGQLAVNLDVPIYQWSDSSIHPRAIVLAIHGLALHGTIYDAWARNLAAAGYVVVAPDLRGYGRWHEMAGRHGARCAQSEEDLLRLAAAIRQSYPTMPLFLAGESLGGTLAVRLAANHAELVDGLILSAPAISHKFHLPLKTAADAAFALASPEHQIDVSPYIRNYYSNSQQVSNEEIADPLVRKSLTLSEIVSSCHVIATTSGCIANIPSNMPILIIQGERDNMIGRRSIALLREHLNRQSTSVQIIAGGGHILLETAYVRQDVMDTVNHWLDHHCQLRLQQPATVARQPLYPVGNSLDPDS